MKDQDCILTPARRRRFEIQGYKRFTDSEFNDFKFGIRFAYSLCGTFMFLGLLLTNLIILSVIMIIAFLGTLPPYHPFDYFYNYVIRHIFNNQKIPPRPNQGRFACGIATVWVGGVIYLYSAGFNFWGYIAGGTIVSIAILVSTLDICIPSII